MAWISVHESVDGPKLRNLYKQLGCSKFEALGILNFLWIWGLTNAEKDGLILFADKEDIERYLYGVGSGCKLSPKQVVDALFDTGWIDQTPAGLYIHDWEMWQDQWYKAKERRESDARRKRESRKNKPPERKADEGEDKKKDAPAEGHADNPQDKPEGKEDRKEPEAQPAEPRYIPAFEQFWAAYPRKEEKGAAYKKYNARLNDGYSEEELLMAAEGYAVQCKRLRTEKRYIKHPKTFLSDSLPFLDFLPKRDQRPNDGQEQGNKNPFEEWEDDT